MEGARRLKEGEGKKRKKDRSLARAENRARGQFAENFKNATPRSARNGISQRILIQKRPRESQAWALDTDYLTSLQERERFSAAEPRSRDATRRCTVLFDTRYIHSRTRQNIDRFLITKYNITSLARKRLGFRNLWNELYRPREEISLTCLKRVISAYINCHRLKLVSRQTLRSEFRF